MIINEELSNEEEFVPDRITTLHLGLRRQPPKEPVTRITRLFGDDLALGEKVYYIHPDSRHSIKRGFIKCFVWIGNRSYIGKDYDVELEDGIVVSVDNVFHTIGEARRRAISNLTRHLNFARNQLATLQRDVELTERLLATLKSYENKETNNRNSYDTRRKTEIQIQV